MFLKLPKIFVFKPLSKKISFDDQSKLFTTKFLSLFVSYKCVEIFVCKSKFPNLSLLNKFLSIVISGKIYSYLSS